ncbi:hypothetical protein EHQ58_07240 [Leptospira ognonensis]|uniref:GAF domain-containing protein n=1 Tax=Leptospira ognonensis TaxID=2484945 RepID=A0A4R9K543_9LEPT|nr:hypothetical protein [Leptospira ognonensis]TGL60284.1 hypothetical protein EHQ58_07240 [Leptospira ognonensis]
MNSKQISLFFKKILPSSYQLKVSLTIVLSRTSYIILVFFTYYLILKQIPDDLTYGLEMSFVLVSAVSILIYLPLVERLTKSLRIRFLSEYLTEDAESFRQAIKQFNLDALIKHVFPDMVKITESHSGTIAILMPDGTFDFHTYFRGRQKKLSPTKQIIVKQHFKEYLKNKKEGSSVTDAINSPDINSDFMELHANFIYPFLFREKLFGFLAVSNIPNADATNTLSLLAGQSAVTIHNHILSYHIAENKKYRKEAEYANRVQDLLETGTIPELPGWKINAYPRTHGNLVEFFQVEDGSWYFVVLNAGRTYHHIGIILSYILGVVYSQSQLRILKGFADIKQLIHTTFQKLEWKDKYELIIGKIDFNELYLIQEGRQFKIIRESNDEEVLASVGWKNRIQLDRGAILVLHAGQPILRFSITDHKK